MNCCKNYKGAFPHNQDIDLKITITEPGKYIFEFTGINGTKLKIEVPITDPASEKLLIPKGILNESMYYCVVITSPSGKIVSENDCENFCFDTYIQTNTTCGDTCPPEENADVINPGDGGNVII